MREVVVGGLATDVHLPDRTPRAVVVVRTPYDKEAHAAEGAGWTARGFAFVVQDVRGRYTSPGTWRPYLGERADGAALLDWIAAQPWCVGKVVLTGASYSAFTAWTAAVERPALVGGVMSLVPAMGFDRVKFDPSGILRLAEHASWWVEHADSRTSRTGLAAKLFEAEPGVLGHLPVVDLADRMWVDLPGWRDVVLAGPGARSPEAVTDAELAALDLPTLHIGGWHDLLVTETLHQWAVVGGAKSLLVGAWGHDLDPSVGRRQLAFVEACAAGGPPMFTEVGVLGTGDVIEWPARSRQWRIDGGAGERWFRHFPAEVGRRETVSFDTGPLEQATIIAGTPVVHLSARADAPAADWIVSVVERRPDGRVSAIADGAVIGREGPFDLTLTPTAYRAAAGSAIVVEIAGSDFPCLARNLGTGKDRYTTTETRVVRQIVDLTGTWLVLPVVDP